MLELSLENDLRRRLEDLLEQYTAFVDTSDFSPDCYFSACTSGAEEAARSAMSLNGNFGDLEDAILDAIEFDGNLLASEAEYWAQSCFDDHAYVETHGVDELKCLNSEPELIKDILYLIEQVLHGRIGS